jgi:heptosyltransferase-3
MILDRANISKILVIKLRAIGDVLLSTVVLENLRCAFPSATIDFLTESASRDVLSGNPMIDDLVVFSPKKDSAVGLIAAVRRRKYDLVIDLFANPRSAIVTALSGARYRVGFPFGWRKYCYNILAPARGGEVHNTEFNLEALQVIGVPIVGANIRFLLDPAAEEFAESFFRNEGLDSAKVVAMNPGGGWYTKRWPIPKFAQLGDVLARELGVGVLIVWGPGELEDANRLQSLMRERSLIIPFTNLKQLASVLKRVSLFVTNDSGPMHIAAAVGTPVLAIFGPTNPKLQGPVGEQHVVVRNENLICLGCNYTRCPIGIPCMEQLSVEEVMEGVREVMRKNDLALRR